jgi:hypothetical protein
MIILITILPIPRQTKRETSSQKISLSIKIPNYYIYIIILSKVRNKLYYLFSIKVPNYYIYIIILSNILINYITYSKTNQTKSETSSQRISFSIKVPIIIIIIYYYIV